MLLQYKRIDIGMQSCNLMIFIRDSMLPGVRVTAGLGFFLCSGQGSGCLGDSEDQGEDSDFLLQN